MSSDQRSWKADDRPDLADTSRRVIAYSCIALGCGGIVAPRSMARMLGDDPDLARRLAARDLVFGVVLLRWRSGIPLVVRALADGSDAIRLRRRSPLVAVGALLFGAWCLGTAGAYSRSAISGSTRVTRRAGR